MANVIRINLNGIDLDVPEGTSVAAAVFQAGVWTFRTSVKGQPRAALCGMGICFGCRLTVDGLANVKSCQLPVRKGMSIRTS